MFKKNIKQFSLVLFLVFILSLPFIVFAQGESQIKGGVQSEVGIVDKLKLVGTKGGYNSADETSFASSLGLLANVLLSLLGVVFIILMIIGGFQWMTAGGNEEQVKKAQARIKNAIIGLVITISAFAIWRLIDTYFINRI